MLKIIPTDRVWAALAREQEKRVWLKSPQDVAEALLEQWARVN